MAIDALLPAGGEFVMLYAGALAAGAIAGHGPVLFGTQVQTGLEAYFVLSLAGTLGYLLGALAGWTIGARGGHALIERHGRWLHITPANLRRAERWFDRYGSWAVFLGRLTPVVRSFMSIPAGLLRSPAGRYSILTLAGSAIWCFGFAAAGWALGRNYERVHHAFGYTNYVVVVTVLVVGTTAVVLHRRRAKRT